MEILPFFYRALSPTRHWVEVEATTLKEARKELQAMGYRAKLAEITQGKLTRPTRLY
jgi:hypothetical protein